MSSRLADLVLLILLCAVSVRAAVVLEVSAGPALSMSANDSLTFQLDAPATVRLDFIDTATAQQNEQFGCASYPQPSSFCEGTLGASLSLVATGQTTPILFRSLAITYRHTTVDVITSGDEGVCVFDPNFCRATLPVGSYTLMLGVDVSNVGRQGADPAPVMRSVAGQVTFVSSAPEPASWLQGMTALMILPIARRSLYIRKSSRTARK